jgi:selenocysteine lyase/cysteine desulfurase
MPYKSLGALSVYVKRDNVDFLTAVCCKSMLGPLGIGYSYVCKELIEKFEPPFIGWTSVKPEIFETLDFWQIRDLKLSETASQFEVGTPSSVSMASAVNRIKPSIRRGHREHRETSSDTN